MILLLAFVIASGLPSPDPLSFWQWILSAAAAMWLVKMVKETFTKTPPDHERWADRRETNSRLQQLETHVSDIKKQAGTDKEELLDRIGDVPAETIALLKSTKGLIG